MLRSLVGSEMCIRDRYGGSWASTWGTWRAAYGLLVWQLQLSTSVMVSCSQWLDERWGCRSGDMLRRPEPDTLERHARASGRQVVMPEDPDPEDVILPKPVALEEALPDIQQGASQDGELISEQPAHPQTEPEPESEPEPEPEPEPEGEDEDAAKEALVEAAIREFDQLDADGDGVLTREEFNGQSERDEQLSKRFEEEATLALQRSQVPPEVSKFLTGQQVPVSQLEREDMHAWFGESEDESEDENRSRGSSKRPEAQEGTQAVVRPQLEPCVGLMSFLNTVKPGFGELYAPCLQQGGFETGRALSLARVEDLQQCGVALGHALLIVDTIQKVAQYL
eukprot:TRINITY_DN2335_c0_g1_i2.p1 TRINITY_DN2335_c0_g1~~TRINITY_DN2335_c0_g1_i2.p1  ORF type:complete len:338 (+),score=79.87 TRINITY_DN2335_c0_g1_i2:174-1187(+)